MHQDLIDDYGNLEGAVVAFVSEGPSQVVTQLIADIDAVIRRFMSEEDVRWLLTERMGSYYCAEADSMTYTQWLKHLRALLVAHSGSPDKP